VCSCEPGYVLQDGKRCKAVNEPQSESASVIFANSVNIQQVDLEGKVLNVIDTNESLTLDFDHRNRSLCWLSHNVRTGVIRSKERLESSLVCAKMDSPNSDQWTLPDLDLYSLKTISQITYDWTSGNWYFIDNAKEIILLCSLNEQHFLCKTILSTRISKPRGLALDPNEDVLFFTVWGSTPPKVERCSMDGQLRKVIVDTKIAYPYGISVDHANKKVYWVDTYLDMVERIDYDGNQRETVVKGTSVHNVYSIALFETKLYVSSWRENSIAQFDKYNPIILSNGSVLVSHLQRPFEVRVFHRQRQPIDQSSGEGQHVCKSLNPCHHVSYSLFSLMCSRAFSDSLSRSSAFHPSRSPIIVAFARRVSSCPSPCPGGVPKSPTESISSTLRSDQPESEASRSLETLRRASLFRSLISTDPQPWPFW
jgi:low-density lipoprotein receptor-related protein 1 (alpha-2-macroglobulin receptor)